MPKSAANKGQVYTIGHKYRCGKCKQESRNFKNERGMKMWCRLHFKKNPDCQVHHKKYGLGDGFNNSFVDGKGKKHNCGSARHDGTGVALGVPFKMPKLAGHQKADTKCRMKDQQDREKYLMRALGGDDNFEAQIAKDILLGKTNGEGWAQGKFEREKKKGKK